MPPYQRNKYLRLLNKQEDTKMANGKKRVFGVEVCFAKDTITLEQLFGSKPIMSTQMAKVIWTHLKARQLEQQKDWQPKAGEKVKYYWAKDKRWYAGEIVKANGKEFTVKDINGSYKVKRNELLKV